MTLLMLARVSGFQVWESLPLTLYFFLSLFFFHFRSFQTSKCLSDWDDPLLQVYTETLSCMKQEKLLFIYG